MVTYGGMSKEPVILPTSAFIFKNLICHGFWMTRWYEDRSNETARMAMLDDLFGLARAGLLREPWHTISVLRDEDPDEKWKDVGRRAVRAAMEGFGGKK